MALRAVGALLLVHVVTITFAIGLAMLDGRSTRFGGASLAVEFARDELVFGPRGWVMRTDGAFASLAARNPSLWLIGGDGVHKVTVGDPPLPAQHLFGWPAEAEVSGGQGLAVLMPDGAIEQSIIGGRPILLAAGGVDPNTITASDVLRSFSLVPLIGVILGLGVLGAIALLLAAPLLSRVIRPIIDEATSIQPDEVGRRLDESRAPPELLPLAHAFNGALERLESELGHRKRLISNVAHELRTPLAVLSLRVDTLSAPTEERETLRTAVQRVSRLAEQMLDLERFSRASGPRIEVSLTEIAQEVISSLAPMAMNAGYELELESQVSPVIVRGDREAIIRAVTNLISNAVQHGGGRGLISVVLKDGQIEVIDSGPGVLEDLRPRLFEAFARGGVETSGSGLGLHLTREVMRGLGGEVDWHRQGARTIFRLRFPDPGSLND